MTLSSVSDRLARDPSFSNKPLSPPFPRSPSFPPIRPPFSSRFFSWIHNNQLVVASIILLFTVLLYCLATRYAPHPNLPCSVDRWTGRLIDSDCDSSND